MVWLPPPHPSALLLNHEQWYEWDKMTLDYMLHCFLCFLVCVKAVTIKKQSGNEWRIKKWRKKGNWKERNLNKHGADVTDIVHYLYTQNTKHPPSETSSATRLDWRIKICTGHTFPFFCLFQVIIIDKNVHVGCLLSLPCAERWTGACFYMRRSSFNIWLTFTQFSLSPSCSGEAGRQ